MAHVFASYAHLDGDFVILLKLELEKAGFEVWIDSDRLRAGEDWRQSIDEAIRFAFAVVVIVSPEAVQSPYVTYEWAYALGLGIKVIPVMLHTTPLHPRLETLQYLDFTHRTVRPWATLADTLHRIKDDVIRTQLAKEKMSARPGTSSQSVKVITQTIPTEVAAKVQEYLNALLENDMAATHQILEMGDAALPILLEALLESDREIQGIVAYVFEQMGKRGVLYLLEAMKSSRATTRLAAIRGLGILEITDAVPGILYALRDENADVRMTATQTLTQIGRPAVPKLLDALTDLHVERRIDAAWTLGEIGDPQAVPGLLKTLYDDSSDVRITAADALGEIGGEKAVEGLLQVLSDGDDRVRYAAVLALGRIGDRTAVPGLLTILSSQDSDLRHLTTAVLGDIGDPAAAPVLLEILVNEQEDEQVRVTAAAALGEIGNPQAVPVLKEMLHHISNEIASAAARSLGKMKDLTNVPALVASLCYEDPVRRCAVARALGEMGSEEAVPHLISLLADRNSSSKGERVCNVAAEALKRINTPTARNALQQWKQRG